MYVKAVQAKEKGKNVFFNGTGVLFLEIGDFKGTHFKEADNFNFVIVANFNLKVFGENVENSTD